MKETTGTHYIFQITKVRRDTYWLKRNRKIKVKSLCALACVNKPLLKTECLFHYLTNKIRELKHAGFCGTQLKDKKTVAFRCFSRRQKEAIVFFSLLVSLYLLYVSPAEPVGKLL